MYLVVETATNKIKFAEETGPTTVNEERIIFPTFHIGCMNVNTATIVETEETLPEDWIGDKYMWVDSTFAENPDYVPPPSGAGE